MFFLIRPKYHGPLVVILKGFHFSFQITVLDVDLHLICSACFAQRNRGRCYPSNSHGFQLRKIGAAIYLFIYLFYFEQYLFRGAQFSEAGLNGALMKRTNNTIRDYVCLFSKLQFPSHLFLFRNYYLRLVIFEGILASSSRVFFVVPCSILRLTMYMFFHFLFSVLVVVVAEAR